MSDVFATLRGPAGRLRSMVEEVSVGFHEDLYVNIDDDVLHLLMQTNGRQVVSYGTFNASHFDLLEGDAEAILPVGGSASDQKGYLDYLDFAESSGTVEMTFEGNETDGKHGRLASHWQASGALNVRLRLPTSQDDLEAVPWGHPKRWTPTNEYASKACLDDDGELPADEDDWITPPTAIETTVGTVASDIVEPVEFTDGPDKYPIVVEDGDFTVRVEGDQKDDSIWGTVKAESVEGPDVNREFQTGFAEVFDALSGPVTLQTAPQSDDGPAAPLSVVQDDRASVTVRHVLGGLA